MNAISHSRRFLTNGVVAHRGAWRHGRGAQNSMTAFRDAIKKGFAYLECDVNLTLDEQLVVAHGPRATDDSRSPIIATTDLRTLQRVPLGNDDHLPRLSEVLEEVVGQDRTGVILDIKPTPGGSKNDLLATQIVATVRDMAAQASRAPRPLRRQPRPATTPRRSCSDQDISSRQGRGGAERPWASGSCPT